MTKIGLSLACILLCGAAPCLAQAVPAAKTLELSKVILDTESGAIKGKLRGGTLCISNGPIDGKFNKQKRTQDYERYDTLFSEKVKAAGFNVYAPSHDMFGQDADKSRGDYLVGATMRLDTLNLCDSVKGQKGDVTLVIEWQIYDRAAQKVVETITTQGAGEQVLFSNTGLTDMWNKAFQTNLVALIDRGVIQKYVGAPTPAAKPKS